MTFSRGHAAMLAVVGIFTGMIAPGVSNSIQSLPYPLTDVQWVSYGILFFLLVLFYAASTHIWGLVRFFGVIILILIGYLFTKTLGQGVSGTQGVLGQFSWGWIFLVSGSLLLIYSMFGSDEEGQSGSEMLGSTWDKIIGIVGVITLFCLAGLIIFISWSGTSNRGNSQNILGSTFGAKNLTVASGITLSPAMPSIEKLSYDRGANQLSFFTTNSGGQMVLMPQGLTFDRLPYEVQEIGGVRTIVEASGAIEQNNTVIGQAVMPQNIKGTILALSGTTLSRINKDGETTYAGNYSNIRGIRADDTGDNIIWKTVSASGTILYKNGAAVAGPYASIHDEQISSNGVDTMALVNDASGSNIIIKNSIKIGQLRAGYVPKSFVSNGAHSFYTVNFGGYVSVVFDDTLIDKKFDEVREVILDQGGGSGYAFFAKPIGSSEYCLFTRYRGNLCGFSGYMNPTIGADKSSVVFAGYKDGKWGIYRDVNPIIEDTGYTHTDISGDYIYFDITNPHYYVFISKDADGYRIFKRGAYLGEVFDDVGLDAQFGYNGTVIMSVKDAVGWRVAMF